MIVKDEILKDDFTNYKSALTDIRSMKYDMIWYDVFETQPILLGKKDACPEENRAED